ncbi:hypothetical protein CSTERTH_06745 [Thermoclostridium stercorarium subsp. thermolacticum DSM 2910]|uniref:Uncharacterized protein n=1 Tax=Thermoclostridium stercorarium subsp. thermolacticum DSM 2910 TaxID=1121336 RepID=A0A1B1YDA8_THEST|nr:hypothetical protein [Thermoclostridium stercorarium]AGI39404.1 hypothetical protein Clst_1343 [Thermoclostridium stercorarium subsp. stercorarium DSM 8532]ANW98745.1 hypothetical protein CSTERTH_06745 [Thermoclostridium stercorarium subsp. thermolacticum DSM 2910]
MNGYYYNPGQGYYHGHNYAYGGSYPVRVQCPYCLNLFDVDVYNIQNTEYYRFTPVYPKIPYANMGHADFGYDNLYPSADNTHSIYYNKSGYICPCDNVNNPWDNNKMYTSNENSLSDQETQ